MKETWSIRLYLFCLSNDIETLTNLAVSTTGSSAELMTFSDFGDGVWGCNTASTEDYREKLNSGLVSLMSSGAIGTIYVARLDNGTNILRSSYSASPSGYGAFGGTIGEEWEFFEALSVVKQLENV